MAETATRIAPGAHGALLVDQAGWRLAERLIAPPDITPIPLPAKCPELNDAGSRPPAAAAASETRFRIGF